MGRRGGWSWLVLAACGPTVGMPGQEGGGSGESGADATSDEGVDDGSSDEDGTPSRCGDGVVDPEESCDEGLATSSCNEHCRIPGSLLQEVVLAGCGAADVRGDTNGDVVVLEDGCISGTNVQAVQLTRVDHTGATLWSEFWTDPETSYASAHGLALDAAGNAIVVGTAQNGNIVQPVDGYAWTRKHDPTGALVWMDVHVRGEGHTNDARDVAVDGAGNLLVAGGDYPSAWVRALDPAGAFAWELEEDLDGGLGHTVCIDATAAGAFVLALNQQPDVDDWITRVLVYGESAPWEAVIDRSVGGRDLPHDVVLADSGAVHVVGAFEDLATYENTVFAAALSPTGEAMWTWEHDAPSDARGIAVDGSGNSFVLMTVGEYQEESLVLTRLSPGGAIDWQETIAGPDQIGLSSGVTLDADENPVVAAEPTPDQSWVAWFAR